MSIYAKTAMTELVLGGLIDSLIDTSLGALRPTSEECRRA